MVFDMFARALASLSLVLKQPLEAFCELETAHGDALVTKHGDYLSFVRIDGMRRMATRADIERIAMAMRVDIGGALENRGHAIVGYYVSDPEQARVEIERVNMTQCRSVAREVGLDLADILDERMSLWPSIMRWEGAYFVLWTRTGLLTKEERKHMREEWAAQAKECRRIGAAQAFFLRSEVMAARHEGFVTRVLGSLRAHDIAASILTAHEALTVSREAVYRETVGSGWKPSLPGDRVMPRLPEEGGRKVNKEGLLWPRLGSQIFHVDAVTRGGQRVEIGAHEYGSVDMAMGPEDPRPFLELAASLGRDRIPWRAAMVVEGGGKTGMMLKEIGATFLSMFPTNADLRRAFDALREARERDNHISVRLRVSFATWAPVGETRTVRRRVATLGQRIEGWGNCRATTIAGDPLEGLMSSVPGLALASTAAPSLALLGDAMAMLPWQGSRSPWKEGSVLFRRPDGVIWPYDPAGGSMRPSVVDLFVAPPGSGKSVLANAINLGLCLSPAVLGAQGAKLPLIGKVDVGPSAEGFVRLVQEALGPARRHEAIYTRMQLTPDYAFNIFDLQVGCEYPLPLEKAFLQNYLTLVTVSPGETKPFEGMPQMISLVIDEAYRRCTDVAGGSPKRYRRGVAPRTERKTVVAMMPKAKGDPYFVSCRIGAEEAARELNIELLWDGPTDLDPAKQNEVVEGWITRGVDVIAVSVENQAGISTVLRKARSKGIKVITWDADAQPDARDFFINQATPQGIGNTLVDEVARVLHGKGEFAIVTASLSAANQNEWMKYMKLRLAEKYPNVKLAVVRPSDGDRDRAFAETQTILNVYPNVKVITGIAAPAVPGAAEAVKQSGRHDVKVNGLSLPNMCKPFVHAGVIDSIILWNTKNLGYLTVVAGAALHNGTLHPGVAQLTVGRLGVLQVNGDEVMLGPPLIFTAQNIDQFNF